MFLLFLSYREISRWIYFRRMRTVNPRYKSNFEKKINRFDVFSSNTSRGLEQNSIRQGFRVIEHTYNILLYNITYKVHHYNILIALLSLWAIVRGPFEICSAMT